MAVLSRRSADQTLPLMLRDIQRGLLCYQLITCILFGLISIIVYHNEYLAYFIGQWSICAVTVVWTLFALHSFQKDRYEGITESHGNSNGKSRNSNDTLTATTATPVTKGTTPVTKVVGAFLLLETLGRILSIVLILIPSSKPESNSSRFVWIHFLWSLASGIVIWVVFAGMYIHRIRAASRRFQTNREKNMQVHLPTVADNRLSSLQEVLVLTEDDAVSITTIPGTLADKLSITTSIFNSVAEGLVDYPVHIPFGTPIPPTPTPRDSNDSSYSDDDDKTMKSNISLAYSDWNGDHRWSTYFVKPIEPLQIRDPSPLRIPLPK